MKMDLKIVCFTYLRGLVAPFLWVLNGNAHYHHKGQYSRIEKGTTSWYPHRTWWDQSIWPLSQAKAIYLYGEKRLVHQSYFGWWIRMCGGFRSTVKIRAEQINPVNMWKRATVPWLCSQVKPSFSRRPRRCCHRAKWRRSVSYQWYWPKTWKGWQRVNAWYELDIQWYFGY